MEPLSLKLSESSDFPAALDVHYTRRGSEKSMVTELYFGDHAAAYEIDATVTYHGGETATVQNITGVKVTVRGSWENGDILKMMELILKSEDLQRKVLYGR